MNLPPEKTKLSAEERRTRQADRLTTIRLRMAIGYELDKQGIITPAAIGEALGMPAAEATKLLTHRQWREGDVSDSLSHRTGYPPQTGCQAKSLKQVSRMVMLASSVGI